MAVAAARGLNHSYGEVLSMPWDEMLLALDASQALDDEAADRDLSGFRRLFGA